MADQKPQDVEKDPDVIIIDGVEYVRKNKKKLLEEPVIVEDPAKILLTE